MYKQNKVIKTASDVKHLLEGEKGFGNIFFYSLFILKD